MAVFLKATIFSKNASCETRTHSKTTMRAQSLLLHFLECNANKALSFQNESEQNQDI